VECHGEKKQKGKVRLDNISFSVDSLENAERWSKVLLSINSGEMPPEDAKQPEKDHKADFLEALSQTMVAARKALTDQGGKITMRRLNRREFQNSIQELLGIKLDVGTLPPDGGSDTFDTVGASLFMSPDQFEIYRQLGKKALDLSFKAARSLSDLRVRIKINAPECPLSRFYSDLGLLPWSKTGDFGEKRAKPDSLLAPRSRCKKRVLRPRRKPFPPWNARLRNL
jgi:hypothetical protein